MGEEITAAYHFAQFDDSTTSHDTGQYGESGQKEIMQQIDVQSVSADILHTLTDPFEFPLGFKQFFFAHEEREYHDEACMLGMPGVTLVV